MVPPDHQVEVDPFLADAVRDVVVQPVDEVTARRHLGAIVAAAEAGVEPASRRSQGRRRAWLTGLAAGAAALLAPLGLAFAGVALPDVVERPYRAVGISLPEPAREAPPSQSAKPGSSPASAPGAPAAGLPEEGRARGSGAARRGSDLRGERGGRRDDARDAARRRRASRAPGEPSLRSAGDRPAAKPGPAVRGGTRGGRHAGVEQAARGNAGRPAKGRQAPDAAKRSAPVRPAVPQGDRPSPAAGGGSQSGQSARPEASRRSGAVVVTPDAPAVDAAPADKRD